MSEKNKIKLKKKKPTDNAHIPVPWSVSVVCGVNKQRWNWVWTRSSLIPTPPLPMGGSVELLSASCRINLHHKIELLFHL